MGGPRAFGDGETLGSEGEAEGSGRRPIPGAPLPGMRSAAFVPRALLAPFFAADGALKLIRPERSIESLSGMGLPFPTLLNFAAAAIEIGGAACLVAGFLVRPAAYILALYLLPATFFRNALMAREHPSHLLDIAKDLALVGGLLAVARLRRRCRRAPDD